MVNFGIFVHLESAELHRCLTGSGFVGNARESSDVLLPDHLTQASAREILLWVDNETEQRYLKWIGCCERCELNGDALAMNEEYTIDAGDELVVTAKTGSATLRYCPNEQSAAICVAAAQRSKRRPAKKGTKSPPPAPPLPTRESLAAKFALRAQGGKPAAPPPAPPLPPRGTFTAKLTENQSMKKPAAAPPSPPMPSREVLADKLVSKQQTATAPGGPPPAPVPPPPPPAGRLRAPQPPSQSLAPDPRDFLQQLAMAVRQQNERLQQVQVTTDPVQTQPTQNHAGSPPSQQMLQNALATLKCVPAEAAPPADAAISRPSDPFARNLSIATTRDSFEPTVYLDDLGVTGKSSMYKRASQSMRPSFAPVLAEHAEQESLRRSALAPEVSSSPAVLPDTERCVQAIPSNSTTPAVSVYGSHQAQVSQRLSIQSSFAGRTPVGAQPSRAAATPGTIASGQQSAAASVARSISLAQQAVSPHVASQSNCGAGSYSSKPCTTPGSVSVGLHTLKPTLPPSAAQSVHDVRQPKPYVASDYARTPASVGTGQEMKSRQHSQTQQVDLAEFLRLKYILSRVQTLLPEGCADVSQDVEGFLAQVKKCMVPLGSDPSVEPGAQSPAPSITASALTVQQEMKKGLGKGKDLMMVRQSAPQATTVSRLSGPAGSNTPKRSRGSWIVQGPNFAVPSRDAEALVGRRLWRHCKSVGWAPGTVTEYLPPNGDNAGTHVVAFAADTTFEYEDYMHLMDPTEEVSWRDPNQKVRCRPVNSSQYPAVTVSQPPASEITAGAMMDAAATPSVLGPRNANMEPSTAGSLAPDFPMLDSSNSSPLLPLAGPVWATPGAFTGRHIVKPSTAGASIPLPSPQTQTTLQGTDRAGTTTAPQLTPIRSNTIIADGGVPGTWWDAINSGNISRCTDMLADMLRSPAAAQLPDHLRLPLESAVASACASPTVTLGVNPRLASETTGLLGHLSAPVHEEPSPMEGVEMTASPSSIGARSSSEYDARDLTACLGTEFLQAEPFSQGAGGADCNFTQPLSPSIFHTTALLGNIAAGTSGVQNAAGGFDWLVSETDAAMQLSPTGATPVSRALHLPVSAGANTTACTAAIASEKQDSANVPNAAVSSIPSVATGATITTCPDGSTSRSLGVSEALTANDAVAAAATAIHVGATVNASGNKHTPADVATLSGDDAHKQQSKPARVAGSGELPILHEPEGVRAEHQQDKSTAAVHGPTHGSTTTESSVQAQVVVEGKEQDAQSRPASPLSAFGIPTQNSAPTGQAQATTGSVPRVDDSGIGSPEASISVGMAAQPAENTANTPPVRSPGVHLHQDKTSPAATAAVASAEAPQHAPTLVVPNRLLPMTERTSPRAVSVAAPISAKSLLAPPDAIPALPSFQPRSCSPPPSSALPLGEAVEAAVATVIPQTGGAGTPKWRASVKAGVPKSPLSSAGMISEALSPRGSLDAPVQPTADGSQTPVAFAGTPVAFAAAAESVAGKSTLLAAAQFTRGMEVAAKNSEIPAEAPHSSVSAAGSSHSPIAAPHFAGNSSMNPTARDGAWSPEEQTAEPGKAAFGSPTAASEDVVLEDVAKAAAQDQPACTPEEHPLPLEFMERRVTPVVCAWRSTDRLDSPSPSPSKAAEAAPAVLSPAILSPNSIVPTVPAAASAASPQIQRTPLITRTLVGDMPPSTGLRGAATPNVTPMSAHPSALPNDKLPVNLTEAVNALLHDGNNMADAVPPEVAGSPLVAISQHLSCPASQDLPALAGATPEKSASAVATVEASLPGPAAADCVSVMNELTDEQLTLQAEISIEQLAAIRSVAKRPSPLRKEAPPNHETSQPVASPSKSVEVPVEASDTAANAEVANINAAGFTADLDNAASASADGAHAQDDDATVPGETDGAAPDAEVTEEHLHDQENADPPAMLDAALSERDAKLASISTVDAQEAIAAAKAAAEADGPARRTRRRASLAIAPASIPLDAPALAPSRSGVNVKAINVQDARAALAAAKAASSQEGSVLHTRKRLSMSVSADVESVRKSQATRLLECIEDKEDPDSNEDAVESPHEVNTGDSVEDKDRGHQSVSASLAPQDEEEAAPKGPLTRWRRASVAVHQIHDQHDSNTAEEAPTERRNTRRKRDEAAALETEISQEVADAPGPCLRTRARCGGATAQPTASDTSKTRQGAAKRTRATRATAADSAAMDGNVSDSEGPVTRRRAKVGAVAAESEEAGGASAGTTGGKRKRGQRRNKNDAADVESESCMTDASESVADGEENKGSAAVNSATSKLAASEAEGIRTETFRPKLSAVPEEEEATIKKGRPGRRKKPYLPIPDMAKMLSTVSEQPVRRSARRTCSQTTS